jgi:hypothetical protein
MKRGSRGIPSNLKPLAKRGERVRFNGFWLNEGERDRVIAAWIDATPRAALIVKALIYAYATGSVVQNLDNQQPEDEREIGIAGSILGAMDD